MNRRQDRRLVVGLDIGTSKVVALVGEIAPGEPLEIVGIGTQASRGLKRGVVVDIDATVQSIQRAVEEAEDMAGCEIRSVYAGISGSHLRCHNSDGTVAIRNQEVSASDVERVLEAARALPIPADQRVLYVEPQEFVIDGQDGIRHPVGMSGVRLEAKVHLVTGASSAALNIAKCVARCGLSVDGLVPKPVASSLAALTQDERELGVCLVDIGAGTTDIAVFFHGALRHTASLPIAGDQVTNDIAVALRTPTPHAEDIKIRYACALAQLATAEETVQVASVGDRPPRRMARQSLAQVVQPRYEELLGMVQAELRRAGYESLVAAGVVLTGGAAKMEGLVELAEEILHMPVRLSQPQFVKGAGEAVADPAHATGVGLLLYGARGLGSRGIQPPVIAGVGRFLGRLRDWWRSTF